MKVANAIDDDSIQIVHTQADKKKAPLYLNLEQTLAKKAHDENEERRKNQPKKTILEMYRTIGAVNGPGWRPKKDRPVLETSVCLMLDADKNSKASPVKPVRKGVLEGHAPMRDMGVGKPTKLLPLDV